MLGAFTASLEREPVLVAPTSDDVDRLERELCATPGGILGGTVTSFPGLFREVGRAVGIDTDEALSGMQRIWLARAAAARAPLRRLARSARREGFAPAVEALLSDLQASGLDAAGFAATVAEGEGGDYERELVALFAAYEELRDGRGVPDEHQIAARTTAGLRADPRAWSDRPVFLYGFDDLTREQIELIDALGGACEVTATVTFEDRQALAARAGLLGVLRDELGATVTEVSRSDAVGGPELLRPPRAQSLRARGERGSSRRVAEAARGAPATAARPS